MPQAHTDCWSKASPEHARSQPGVWHLAHRGPRWIIKFKKFNINIFKEVGCMSRIFACWLTSSDALLFMKHFHITISGLLQQPPPPLPRQTVEFLFHTEGFWGQWWPLVQGKEERGCSDGSGTEPRFSVYLYGIVGIFPCVKDMC